MLVICKLETRNFVKRVSVDYILSTVNHPWWMSMLFHRWGLLWLGSAVRYNYFRPYELGKSVGALHVILIMRCMEYLADTVGAKYREPREKQPDIPNSAVR